MAQQQAAQQVTKLLTNVGRFGIILGVGGSALQASLYTGAAPCPRGDGSSEDDVCMQVTS